MLLLCYFIVRVDTILAVGSRYPETNKFVTVFCLFSISRAGFSSVARKPLRSVRVNGVGSHEIGSGFNSRRRSHEIGPGSIRARELCFESHSLLYSKPRGSRSRHLHLTHDTVSVL